MHICRTAEAFARLLATHPDPELKSLLQVLADRLADYEDYTFEELAEVLIVEPGDTLDAIDAALGRSLLDGDTFARPVELIAPHARWIEAVTILDDTGFGLILFVPLDERTDQRLLAACKHALIEG